MKPEFSEVLIPSSKENNKMFTTVTSPDHSKHLPTTSTHSPAFCCFSKWLGIISILFGVFIITILIPALVLRYENKLAQYETRISLLEDELGLFFQQFESSRITDPVLYFEDEDVDEVLLQNNEDDEDDSSSYEEEEAEEILFPKTTQDPNKEHEKDKKVEEELGKLIFGVSPLQMNLKYYK